MDHVRVHEVLAHLMHVLSGMVAPLVARHDGRPDVDRVAAEVDAPLRVAVRGRPGTGRDTVARALREQLGVAPIGPGDDADDADCVVYVLVGWPRSDDHAAILALPRDRSVVVLGKCDTLGSWEAADERARDCAAAIGRPVIALMPLLGCAELSDDEFALLVGMVERDEPMPSMAATFIGGDGAQRRLRTGLLRRLDQYGVMVAMDEIADALDAACSPDRAATVTALRSESAMAGVRSAIEAMLPVIARRRHDRVVEQLDRIAATGLERDHIESLQTQLRGSR